MDRNVVINNLVYIAPIRKEIQINITLQHQYAGLTPSAASQNWNKYHICVYQNRISKWSIVFPWFYRLCGRCSRRWYFYVQAKGIRPTADRSFYAAILRRRGTDVQRAKAILLRFSTQAQGNFKCWSYNRLLTRNMYQESQIRLILFINSFYWNTGYFIF